MTLCTLESDSGSWVLLLLDVLLLSSRDEPSELTGSGTRSDL